MQKQALRWITGGWSDGRWQARRKPAAPPLLPEEEPPKATVAHTQLNLLTKSYESRSVRFRGGCVSKRCVVCVRVSGLVHKVAPTQAPPLCKTPVTPQLLLSAGCARRNDRCRGHGDEKPVSAKQREFAEG